MKLPSWILTLFLVVLALGDGQPQRHSIYQDLYQFVTNNSKPFMVPTDTLPIYVGVQCNIVAIHSVDREKNTIDLTRRGKIFWDSNLTWDPADFNGLGSIAVPYHSIWLPDLHLYNSDSKFTFLGKPNAVVFSTGEHAMFANIRSTVHCGDNLHEDSCSLRIASWGTNINHLRIKDPSSETEPDNDLEMTKMAANEEMHNSNYRVLSQSYKKTTMQVAVFPDWIDIMEFTFTFKELKQSGYRGPPKAMFSWS